MLTRYKKPLKLKDWALAIGRRSTMRKARIALAGGWPSSCTLCFGTAPTSKLHSQSL